jgi:RNA polymerase sigma factor (sigma-70 family)
MDEDNMSACAAAAPAAELEQLFQAHSGRVFRAAYRITGNAGDAEDVLQTVFLRLLRQGWDAGAVAHIQGYLRRAAVNAALDLVRARQAAQSVSLEAAALAPDSRYQPDRGLAAAELRACLRQAIARLAPRAAEIFALRYFEDCDNREIARLVGDSPAAVAVSLHRSRARLEQDIRSQPGDRHEH